MASLSRTCILCSDCHPETFIGVTTYIKEHVLITCKSVVKDYNVLDRRQERSWTTKSWNPFTSAAVYDPTTENIVAVFNNTILSRWKHDEDDVDKVKRLIFETPIHKLMVSGDSVYVVFTTGQVEDLATAIKSRKKLKPGLLSDGESISYIQIIEATKLVVVVVKKEGSPLRLLRLPLAELVSSTTSSFTLALNNAQLTGICALSSSELITLWSSGELYSFDLQKDYLEKLPGRQHGVEKSIVTSKSSKILELSPNHISIIGLDKGDEGGLLVLWDIKFAMVTSSRKLKMYHNPPLAWVSTEGVIVLDGGSLALIPYIVQESNLATIFGTKVSETQGISSEDCHSWLKKAVGSCPEPVPAEATQTIFSNKSRALGNLIQSLNRGALSESLLVTDVMTHLIQKKDILLLDEAVTSFSNVPETCLIDVLSLYLQCKDTEFEGLCQCPILQMEFEPYEEDAEKILCPFNSSKAHFINGVLQKPFTDTQLLIDLPRLSFSHALSLIQYLHYLITTGEAEEIPDNQVRVPSLCQASLWLSMLLDANYHQLVMTSEVSIHRHLLSCFTHITNLRKFLEGLEDIEPLINRILEAKSFSKRTHSSALYSLERLIIS
nr:nucleolar protein 11-like [Cherax quadricarinatus]